MKSVALLLAVALAAGLGLRFVNLDRKVYWLDETSTLRQIAGHPRAEMIAELVARRQFPAAELERYRQLSPERGTGDLLLALLADSPEIAPLYFVLGRGWTQWMGDSGLALRVLSAVLSLLAVPAMYWLARELTGSVRAGGLAMMLVAVSPFHLLYAQEARMYSLWAVMILVSCAALVRAWRTDTAGSWRMYAATVALGWYTHLLFGLVLVAHTLYARERARQTRPALREPPAPGRRWLFAALAGTVVFVPWLIGMGVGLGDFGKELRFASQPPARGWYAARMLSQFSLPFWDLNITPSWDSMLESGGQLLVWALVLGLVGSAVWGLRREDQAVRRLVLGLIVVGPLFLLGIDLWRGHDLALWHRYVLPSFLAAELAVAGWLARRWDRLRWRLAALALAGAGLTSCVAVVRAENWWTKGQNVTDPILAQVVNESPRPLLVMDLAAGGSNGLLTLSPRLGPHVTVSAIWGGPWPARREGFSDVFVFRPPIARRAELAQTGYGTVATVPFGRLWQLK